jgi:hypothetical protein
MVPMWRDSGAAVPAIPTQPPGSRMASRATPYRSPQPAARACQLREREALYAGRWAAGAWRGARLTTAAGDAYTVVYEGRSGGPAGPDFRDAVLLDRRGERVCGDIELHLRASGWWQHGHDRDPRYAAVMLHLVVHPPGAQESAGSPLPNGSRAPLALIAAAPAAVPPPLPCAGCFARAGPAGMRALLAAAGDERFGRRVARLETEIRDAVALPAARWDVPGRALAIALAEALGYGRDRQRLRAAGVRLVCGAHLPAAGAESGLVAVERARLRGLDALARRWEPEGPWSVLRPCLLAGTPRAAAEALVAALTVPRGEVSRGRALILVANVALPFSAAIEPALAERARAIYAALPGLPSNAITRLMSRQLGMPRQPSGARAQQGLHHLWETVCREKRCVACHCAQ